MPPDHGEASKESEKNAALKETVIRLVTVFAYVSSVSMAALVLSSYYVFFWEPKPPGPGPPVIHPHAYVAEPYPPLKLVAPPPPAPEGASFWQSVWSYLKPDEKVSTQSPMAYTGRRSKTTSTTKIYDHSRSTMDTVTSETFNLTNDEISTLMTILTENTTILPDKEASTFDESIYKKPADVTINKGYVGIIPNRVKRGMKSGEITQKNIKLNKELTAKNERTTTNESELISTAEATSGTTVLHNIDVITENDKNDNNTVEDKVENADIQKTTRQIESKSGREMNKMSKHDTNDNSTDHTKETAYIKDNTDVGKELDKDHIREITNTKDSTDPTTTTKTTLEVKSTGAINTLIKLNTYQHNIAIRNADVGTKPVRIIEEEAGQNISKIAHHKAKQNNQNETKAFDTTDNTAIAEHDKRKYKETQTQEVQSTNDAEILTNTEIIDVAFGGARSTMIKRDTNEKGDEDDIKAVTLTVNETNIGMDIDETEEDKEHTSRAVTHTRASTWNAETVTPHTTTAKLEEPSSRSSGIVNKITKRDTNHSSTDASTHLQDTSANYSTPMGTKTGSYAEREGSSDSVSTLSTNAVTELADDSKTKASHDSLTQTGEDLGTKLLGISDTTDTDELVTKSADHVATERSVESLSTEFDTQYQHHMRQLRPRRKFPSLHT